MARSNSYTYNSTTFQWAVASGLCGTTTQNPMLGNLLLGQCNWCSTCQEWPIGTGTKGPHYLPEIEYHFYHQYVDLVGIDNDPLKVDPYSDYGNTALTGFQWFQYSTFQQLMAGGNVNATLPVLSYPMLSTRAGDQVPFQESCDAYRVINNSPNNNSPIEKPRKIKENIKTIQSMLRVFPNPMTQSGGQIIINDLEQVSFKISDVYGRDVSNKISLQLITANKYILIPTGLCNSVYVVTVTDSNQRKFNQSFTVAK